MLDFTIQETTRLRDYLRPHIGTTDELSIRLLTGGRSNPTYELVTAAGSWILRRPPFDLVLESAHDMGREYRVMSALADSLVPVPRMVALCVDATVVGAPFYVMEKLDGQTIASREDAAALTPRERSALAHGFISTVANLHSIEPAAVGLEGWGRPYGYLERQLRRWGAQWRQAHSRDRPLVGQLLAELEASRPGTRHPGIVHGDVKLDNLMVSNIDPGEPVGLLDWEMSTLGDTQADVGLLWAMWDDSSKPHHPLTRGLTDLPGFPTADAAIEQYSHLRGIEPEPIRWHAAMADLKLAIILEQIHLRRLSEGSAPTIDDVGAMVDPLLERAHEWLHQGT